MDLEQRARELAPQTWNEDAHWRWIGMATQLAREYADARLEEAADKIMNSQPRTTLTLNVYECGVIVRSFISKTPQTREQRLEAALRMIAHGTTSSLSAQDCARIALDSK
jgi:hypothetical protein